MGLSLVGASCWDAGKQGQDGGAAVEMHAWGMTPFILHIYRVWGGAMGLKASPVSNSQIAVASRFCAETTGRAEMAGLIS